MKAFNLDEYLKNPERKVVTRDGRNVRIVCTDVKSELYPVLALVDNWGAEICNSYTKEGRFRPSYEAHCDLFFASEKHEGWVNVYRDFDDMMCGSVFATEEDSKCNAKTAIATVKIEWEE